jgi:hypothetical protein
MARNGSSVRGAVGLRRRQAGRLFCRNCDEREICPEITQNIARQNGGCKVEELEQATTLRVQLRHRRIWYFSGPIRTAATDWQVA